MELGISHAAKNPMLDKITGQIAEFAHRTSAGDLDEQTAHAATQRLIDALGCALGGP